MAGIAFKEEQCGYLAGYAAVKEGFTKLGFTGGGGGTNPACCRYGYGFVQGADAAAKELDETGRDELLLAVRCQLLRFPRAADHGHRLVSELALRSSSPAAVPCSPLSPLLPALRRARSSAWTWTSPSSPTTVITSAMKGLADSVQWALGKFYAGEFASDRRCPDLSGCQ